MRAPVVLRPLFFSLQEALWRWQNARPTLASCAARTRRKRGVSACTVMAIGTASAPLSRSRQAASICQMGRAHTGHRVPLDGPSLAPMLVLCKTNPCQTTSRAPVLNCRTWSPFSQLDTICFSSIHVRNHNFYFRKSCSFFGISLHHRFDWFLPSQFQGARLRTLSSSCCWWAAVGGAVGAPNRFYSSHSNALVATTVLRRSSSPRTTAKELEPAPPRRRRANHHFTSIFS